LLLTVPVKATDTVTLPCLLQSMVKLASSSINPFALPLSLAQVALRFLPLLQIGQARIYVSTLLHPF
jgi:hypothetical protein